jgi:hypothetical protein
MRRSHGFALAAMAIMMVPAVSVAQAGRAGGGAAMEESRTVAGGGINAAGWAGKIDSAEAARGLKLTDSKLVKTGEVLAVTTGPAVTYWNPANRATGDYTVKATFTEAKYMELNNHPHPYGIMIAGNDLGTPQESFLYCAAYGSGTFIVRGFGPAPFQVNGRQPTPHEAVHKAAGRGSSVTQEIAIRVAGGKVDCIINGTVVGSYDKTAVVGPGKLKSTDGVYGIRFAHTTEATVTGLQVVKP